MVEINALSIVALGSSYEIVVGETWRVTVVLIYTSPEATTVTLSGCPYQYRLGILDRINSCCGHTTINLEQTFTPVEKTASVDMHFIPGSDGGIGDGTYGLMAEVDGATVKQDGVLIVSGNPAGMFETIGMLIPMLIIVMMMGMIMPLMEEGMGPAPEAGGT